MTPFEQVITALHSGKYQQGDDVLKRQVEGKDPVFCATGVVADVFIQNHPNVTWVEAERSLMASIVEGTVFRFPGIRRPNEVPHRVFEWSDVDPFVHLPHGCSFHIWELNDHSDMTLDQIADAIEFHHKHTSES